MRLFDTLIRSACGTTGKLNRGFRAGACESGKNGLLLTLLFLLCAFARAETLPAALQRAQAACERARTNYAALPEDPSAAANLARACFELSELSATSQTRATLANEGIKAAKFATEKAPTLAAGHFYLGLNLGELARTKSLGALALLRRMEKAWLKAIELDPHLDHGGPNRSLGMLYLAAPGWPVSVGSKRKAREHLERAVSIEPDYPDNHLSLMEAYVTWGEEAALKTAAERYRKILPQAQAKYSGPKWEQAWHDWGKRWDIIQKAIEEN